MRITVEGWRFLSHSYALVNQFLLLTWLERADCQLFHRDVPYYSPAWKACSGLFDPEREKKLRSLAAPPPGAEMDAVLRINVPFNILPAGNAPLTGVWATTEFGLVQNEMLQLMGVKDLTQVHADSSVLLITCSQWSRAGFIRSGAHPSRVVVVPLGVEPDYFHPLPEAERQALRKMVQGEDKFIFLNVGMMTKNKGTAYLLKAFAIIAQKYPQARLLMKGGDTMYPSLQYLQQVGQEVLTPAEMARVESRLLYKGEALSFLDVARFYQLADAYVTPYLAEGFNLPALEAAACGIPVLCTRGGPTDDFVDPCFARTIDSQLTPVLLNGEERYGLMPSLDHLVALMEEVIQDSALRQQAREQGPRYVQQRFTWKQTAEQMLGVLKGRILRGAA